MSWTSPLTVASTMRPFGRLALDLVHVGLQVGDRRLHGLGRLQHEGQLHLAGAEELAHRLHAVEEHVVDDEERGEAAGQRLVELVGEAVAVAVDDALGRGGARPASRCGPPAPTCWPTWRRRTR